MSLHSEMVDRAWSKTATTPVLPPSAPTVRFKRPGGKVVSMPRTRQPLDADNLKHTLQDLAREAREMSTTDLRSQFALLCEMCALMADNYAEIRADYLANLRVRRMSLQELRAEIRG